MPQGLGKPAVAGNDLAELVQCGALMKKAEGAFRETSLTVQTELLSDDPSQPPFGQSLDKKAQRIRQQGPILGVLGGRICPTSSDSTRSLTTIAVIKHREN